MRKSVTSHFSELDVSSFQVVTYKPDLVGQSTYVAVGEFVQGTELNAEFKVQRKRKDTAKGKVTRLGHCVQYRFKNIFGSVGKCVMKVGNKNVMCGGYPLNNVLDMGKLNLMKMMEGLGSLLGEDHIDKE